jgi:hypothetical protein
MSVVGCSVMGRIAVIDQIDATEVPVVVGCALVVVGVDGVSASRSTRLDVGVSIRADHKRRDIVVVEAIVATIACK